MNSGLHHIKTFDVASRQIQGCRSRRLAGGAHEAFSRPGVLLKPRRSRPRHAPWQPCLRPPMPGACNRSRGTWASPCRRFSRASTPETVPPSSRNASGCGKPRAKQVPGAHESPLGGYEMRGDGSAPDRTSTTELSHRVDQPRFSASSTGDRAFRGGIVAGPRETPPRKGRPRNTRGLRRSHSRSLRCLSPRAQHHSDVDSRRRTICPTSERDNAKAAPLRSQESAESLGAAVNHRQRASAQGAGSGVPLRGPAPVPPIRPSGTGTRGLEAEPKSVANG